MGDTKGNIKAGIDKAASATKDVANKAVDKTKDTAKSVGESMAIGRSLTVSTTLARHRRAVFHSTE